MVLGEYWKTSVYFFLVHTLYIALQIFRPSYGPGWYYVIWRDHSRGADLWRGFQVIKLLRPFIKTCSELQGPSSNLAWTINLQSLTPQTRQLKRRIILTTSVLEQIRIFRHNFRYSGTYSEFVYVLSKLALNCKDPLTTQHGRLICKVWLHKPDNLNEG